MKILSGILVSSIDGMVCCVKEERRDKSVNDSTVSFYDIKERKKRKIQEGRIEYLIEG